MESAKFILVHVAAIALMIVCPFVFVPFFMR